MGTKAKRLAKGRKIRRHMSSELHRLSTGKIRLEDVLRDPSDALGRCRIYDVMRRAPKLGEEGTRKVLERYRVWPNDRLGSIPPEKRSVIIAALPERVKNFKP